MKAKIFTKSAVFAICLTAMCFSTAKAQNLDVPALVPPEGTLNVWTIGDYETAATSITTNNNFDFYVYPWAGNTGDVQKVANPVKDAVNGSNNVLNYKSNPLAQWNGLNLMLVGDYVTTKPDRINLTGWDKFEIDVLAGPGIDIPGFGFKFQERKIASDVVAPTFNPPLTYIGGTAISSTAWVTLSFDLSGLKDLANLKNADNSQTWPLLLELYGKFELTVAGDIFYDNLRFVKSGNTAVSQVNAPVVKVYPNPAINSIKIEGATGEVNIINILGVKLITRPNYNGSDIDVTQLKNGVYLVNANNISTTFIKK